MREFINHQLQDLIGLVLFDNEAKFRFRTLWNPLQAGDTVSMPDNRSIIIERIVKITASLYEGEFRYV